LAPRTKLSFDRFAELDVALRHVGYDVAVLKKRQDAVKPRGTLFGVAPFCALRCGALSSVVDQLPGGISFR
jgi:hypothetical protein